MVTKDSEPSGDCNPYAYPYFHADGTSPLVYDLVVKFGKGWNELGGDETNIDSSLKGLVQLVEAIQCGCQAHPNSVAWRDSCGDTSLHRLCQVARYPPVSQTYMASFTSLLLTLADALISANPGTTVCNNWNETPLHQFVSHCGFPIQEPDEEEACIMSNQANPMLELVKLLSRDGACLMRSVWNSCALHDACELTGWEIDSSSSKATCPRHETPLRIWFKAQHAVIIEWLISQYPGALRSKDGQQQTPLHRAFLSLKCNMTVVEMLLSQMHDTQGVESLLWDRYTSSSLPELDHSPQAAIASLGIVYDCTIAVLLKLNGNRSQLLHTAVSLKDCPLYVIQLLASLHPEQLVETDKVGSTPLILALENGRGDDIVDCLIRKCPAAASVPSVSNGRLALIVAITNSYKWKPTLEALLEAVPQALSERDPITLLYPFAVAAACCTDTEQDDDVSTIYQLLRADPSFL